MLVMRHLHPQRGSTQLLELTHCNRNNQQHQRQKRIQKEKKFAGYVGNLAKHHFG